jgi:O-antigen/teichoic acid export membrane protein
LTSNTAQALRRLSRNTLTLMVSNTGGAILSFALSILIGRGLGEDGLGTYAVVMAWVFPLSLLVEFGLGTLTTRDAAQDARLGGVYLDAMARARLLLGGAAAIALLAFAPLLSADAQIIDGLRLSAPLVVILPFYSAFTAIFRARGAMWPVAWLNLGMLAVQAVWTWGALANGGTIRDALLINMVTSAGQLVAAWAVYRLRFYAPRDSALRLHMTTLLRLAWPFALAALFAALQSRLSSILLESLASTAEVGQFAAASRFLEAAKMLPNAFFGALFPALAALAAQPDTLARTFARALVALGGYGALAAVVAGLIATPLLAFTFGDSFAAAAPALQLLMLSLPFALLRGGRTLYWYALGRERFVNAVNGVVILAQLLLGLLLVPPYGAFGMAAALLVSEMLALALIWKPVVVAHPWLQGAGG